MNSRSARRRNSQVKKQNIKISINKLLILFILVISSIVLLAFLISRNSNWDGSSRLTLAIKNDNGIDVVVLDPASHKLVTITIPGSTVVQAANQMGNWPLSSITQLAKNEGHTSDFIAQTITKTFNMPIENWADKKGLQLVDSNVFSAFIAAVTPFESDLTVADKLKIAWSATSIDDVDRYTVDLSETSFLIPVVLLDGSHGYEVGKSMPSSLAVLFADQDVSLEAAKILLKNNTGRSGISSEIVEIVEIMGGKVFSIENGQESESDCVISGTKQLTIQKIASVFNCTVGETGGENFDVVIEIGKSFFDRY